MFGFFYISYTICHLAFKQLDFEKLIIHQGGKNKKKCWKSLGGCNLCCSPAIARAKSHALSRNDSTVSLQCLLMNRPRCACSCKAGYKGTVGLVGPSATGSDWGHGCLSGFTPLLLSKHTELPDWSGGLSNQGAADPLRTTAAGSASTRSFIGSSARLFYMNQRANYAFLPMFPLLGFVISHKDRTKHEPVAKSAALFIAVLNFSGSLGCVYIHGPLI